MTTGKGNSLENSHEDIDINFDSWRRQSTEGGWRDSV